MIWFGSKIVTVFYASSKHYKLTTSIRKTSAMTFFSAFPYDSPLLAGHDDCTTARENNFWKTLESEQSSIKYKRNHGLRTPREEIAFTARPKIHSHSQIFRYGGSIFRLPHRPKFSDIFDLCLHWVSVVRDCNYSDFPNKCVGEAL